MKMNGSAPALTPDELREKYRDQSKSYDKKIASIEYWSGIDAMRAEMLSRAKGSVLDVAVGTGRNFEHISEDCSITGVDLSPEMLRIAEKRAEELGRDITLKPMNAEY